MKILVTGASGPARSFIVEEALRQGPYETWAAVRPSSSRKYLQDERIHFINLNLSSKEELISQLDGHEFDYVVHAAGATKCLHVDDFYRVNTEGTKNLADAIIALKMPIKRFVFVSSLSIFGAIREKQPYQEITEHDTPKPNTAYGKSKLKAERYLDSLGIGFPYIILRPTGVYGPREKDYFLMAKSIKQHIDFSVGFKRQDITFVYVQDVVHLMFAFNHGRTIVQQHSSATENISVGNIQRPASPRVGRHMAPAHQKAPIWVLRLVTFFGEYIGRMTGKMSALNNDKYNILKQRNWRCDIEPAVDELGFHPRYKLKQGVKLAVEWYKKNGWL